MSQENAGSGRSVTRAFLSQVFRWIDLSGEVLVILRYLHCAGSKDYALIRSWKGFEELVDICPEGTDIIVFRDAQLPMRGKADLDFVRRCMETLKRGEEYLIVNLSPLRPCDPRLHGVSDYLVTLEEALMEFMGCEVAVGVCPDFFKPDGESMVSESKGGLIGPR